MSAPTFLACEAGLTGDANADADGKGFALSPLAQGNGMGVCNQVYGRLPRELETAQIKRQRTVIAAMLIQLGLSRH